MWVPPQVVGPSGRRRVTEVGGDAPQPQGLELPQRRRVRAEVATGRNIRRAGPRRRADTRRVPAGQREVRIREADPSPQERLVPVRPLPVDPGRKVPSVGGQTHRPALGDAGGGGLVAGEHDAPRRPTELPLHHGRRGLQVGPEVGRRLARLQTVVVRERVRPELLVRRLRDAPDERGREVKGILPLVLAHAGEEPVRRQLAAGICGAPTRQPVEELPLALEEEEADGRPGRMHRELPEEREHGRHGSAYAEEIAPVRLHGPLVVDAPVELEVERDDECSRPVSRHPAPPLRAPRPRRRPG